MLYIENRLPMSEISTKKLVALEFEAL